MGLQINMYTQDRYKGKEHVIQEEVINIPKRSLLKINIAQSWIIS